MDRPELGYAIIVNNVTSEIPGSREDTTALVNAYKTAGFKVRHYFNCDKEVRYNYWIKMGKGQGGSAEWNVNCCLIWTSDEPHQSFAKTSYY